MQNLFANAGAETQFDIFQRIAERNRLNAQHSTGPRTPEGKAISCKNALKRGYSLTTHQILNNENPEAYNQMLHDLQHIYSPQSPREHLAVLEISYCKWAIRRLDLAEVTLLNSYTDDLDTMSREEGDDVTGGESIGYLAILRHGEPDPLEFKALGLIQRYRRHWDRRHQEALREYDRAVLARQRAEQQALRTEREQIRKQQEQIKLELLKQKQEAQHQRAKEKQCEKESAAFHEQIEQVLSKRSSSPMERHVVEALQSGFVPQREPQPATQQAAR